MEQPARHDRAPEWIETSTSRHSPTRAGASTSSVPSPPSATGLDGHRRASAGAGQRTPLRLAGHASAFTRRWGPELLDDCLLRLPRLLVGIRRNVSSESPSRMRKISPTPTPTDISST